MTAVVPEPDQKPRSKSSLGMLMALENALEYGPRVLELHGVDAAELAAWIAGRATDDQAAG